MTLSPKKYVSNYISNTTAHRGVEAKEIELANTHLEVDMSVSPHFRREAESSAESGAPLLGSHHSHEDSGSYLQVVVEKHRRKRSRGGAPASPPSPRLPAASSPLTHNQGGRGDGTGGSGGGERGVYVLPHPLLLACPTGSPLCSTLQAHTYFTRRALDDATARSPAPAPRAAPAPPAPPPPPPPPRTKINKSWKFFRDKGSDKLCDNEPDRVELYYFEHGSGEFLSACGGGRPTRVERAARRGARAAGALLAELLAAPRLLLALPAALLLPVQRAVLQALRGAAAGVLQTASDYALKPALALTFNALLQPLLVFCSNVGRGLRAALRPLAGALGDALEPLARVLGAVRLVDVHVACAHHL